MLTSSKGTLSTRPRVPYRAFLLGVLLSVASVALAAPGLDSPNRVELKRTDLTGAPGMEVIVSITELKPGDSVSAHIHHGVEAAYVLQGAMVQVPGKEPMMLATGTSILNLRDVKHGGFTVIGDQNLKIYTVHIVDKGKPLYDVAP